MLKLGVLISGRGSNLQAIIDACAEGRFPAEIALVISNKADAAGLERAKAAGIPTEVINHKNFTSREEFDNAMNESLHKAGVGLVCMAGFMRLLSASFVENWRDRLINIHPSLLPSYKGLDTHKKALADGVRIAGCTVHFVRPEMDVGPIIIQSAVPVLPDDTEESLAARILAAEHVCYPAAVRWFAEGRIKVADEKVLIEGSGFLEKPTFSPIPV